MAKILKNRTVISVGEDKDQREFPRTTSGMYKLVQLLWKNSSVHMQKKKKANIHAPGDIHRIFTEVKIVQI